VTGGSGGSGRRESLFEPIRVAHSSGSAAVAGPRVLGPDKGFSAMGWPLMDPGVSGRPRAVAFPRVLVDEGAEVLIDA
jgi:hypothetical protein